LGKEKGGILMVPAFDDEKLAEAQETLQRHGEGNKWL
jgi:hypothetical protein